MQSPQREAVFDEIMALSRCARATADAHLALYGKSTILLCDGDTNTVQVERAANSLIAGSYVVAGGASVTGGSSPVIEWRNADDGFLFEELALAGNSHFGVTKADGDEIFLVGVYNERPKSAELARILKDEFDGRTKPLA